MPEQSKLRSILMLILFVAICFSAAGIGGLFTATSIDDWYRNIDKPSWNPPSAIFAPVWTVLYLSMAISAWLVWQYRQRKSVQLPMMVFFIQLLLNAAWSGLFFGLQNPGLAFVEICILWLAILTTTLLFWRVRAIAGAILLPYILWVSFAAVLNYTIWRLNT
jgi:tryptophan-rich sensory protein